MNASKAALVGSKASLLDVTLEFENATSTFGYRQPFAQYGFLVAKTCSKPEGSLVGCEQTPKRIPARRGHYHRGEGGWGLHETTDR